MSIIADNVNQLSNKVNRLMERRNKVQTIIDSLDDSMQRQVLDMYFLSIKRMKMEDIARIIPCSVRHIYRIYKKALEELDKKCVIECQ